MLLEWTSGGYRPWRLSAMQYLLLLGNLRLQGGPVQAPVWCGYQIYQRAAPVRSLPARVGTGCVLKPNSRLLWRVQARYLRDSTCVSLHPRLAKAFPGSSNQSVCGQRDFYAYRPAFDVLTRKLLGFTLASFRDNDQKAASDLSLNPRG